MYSNNKSPLNTGIDYALSVCAGFVIGGAIAILTGAKAAPAQAFLGFGSVVGCGALYGFRRVKELQRQVSELDVKVANMQSQHPTTLHNEVKRVHNTIIALDPKIQAQEIAKKRAEQLQLFSLLEKNVEYYGVLLDEARTFLPDGVLESSSEEVGSLETKRTTLIEGEANRFYI